MQFHNIHIRHFVLYLAAHNLLIFTFHTFLPHILIHRCAHHHLLTCWHIVWISLKLFHFAFPVLPKALKCKKLKERENAVNLHFYKQNFICKKDSRDWENPWNFLIYSSICVKKKNKAGLAISSLGPSQNGYFNWKTLVDTLSVSIGHSLYLSNGFFLFISTPPFYLVWRNKPLPSCISYLSPI